MICSKCGSVLQENASFCPNCGSCVSTMLEQKSNLQLQSSASTNENKPKFCPECGTKQLQHAAFCKECGTPLGQNLLDTAHLQRASISPNAKQSTVLPQQNNIKSLNVPPLQKPIAAPQVIKPRHKRKLLPVLLISISVIVLAVVGIFVINPQILSSLPSASVKVSNNSPAISISGNNDGSAMVTSEPVVAAEATISPDGGKICIKQEGNAADGLIIDVPAGSYSDAVKFTISTSDIKTHGFNQNLKLISPLIHVENGGAYSESLMKVTIPCKVPQGSIPLAFYYKPDSTELEFIPVLDYDSNSVTYGVRHFSDTLVGVFDNAFLGDSLNIDTGFSPGTDDFSFVNRGSALAPGGQCAGQSIAAIWYYDNLKKINGPLFGQYDNFGKNPEITFKTPQLQDDDVLAYRLAGVAHSEISALTFKSRAFLQFTDALRVSNETTFNELAALMKNTGSPQLLVIYKTNAAKQITSCHAIIAYKIVGDKVYVADPNKPGQKDRYIQMTGGKFKSYSSAANAQALEAGNVTNYNLISLLGKSALNNYDNLKTMWEDLSKRTIGDTYFPAVNVKFTTKIKTPDGEEEVEVKDGYAATVQNLKLKVADVSNMAFRLYLADKSGNVKNISTNNIPADLTYTFPLQKGDNYVGISLYKQVNGTYVWYDFQWIKVKFDVPSLDELVGTYEDGKVTIAEVFISQELRDKAKAQADAEAEAAKDKTGLDQLGTVGNGCDLKMIEELDKMQGQILPRKFSVEKTAEEEGKIIFSDENGKKTEIPFSYKDGSMNVDYNMAASPETGNTAFQMIGSVDAAYGKDNNITLDGTIMMIAGSIRDFFINEQITGSKPLPPKVP